MKPQQNHITIFEHQPLRIGKDYDGVSFEEEHRAALEAHYGLGKGVKYFSLIHKGIQFNEFVGVIQVGSLVIEVLPKADKYEDASVWRNILIGMLKAVGVFDIHSPSHSSLNIKPNFILDLYFALFVKEVEYLIKEGLTKKYRKTEGNTKALKGSIVFNQHISKNFVHKERFYTRHSVYDQEHLLNQILFKTLNLIARLNSNITLQSRIGSLLLHFPEVSDISVSEDTFSKISYSRKDERYKNAIEISRLLLLNYHPDVSRGRNNVLAIMFDMNLLWERFIYTSLKKFNPENRIILPQTSKNFWKPTNGRTSSLQPDIFIEGNDERIVLDTKWKNLGFGNPSPDDLRQMFAYHKYFEADKVALVYPGDNDHKSGRYFNVDNEELSKKECSVITIPTQKVIYDWQESIAERIFNNWPALIEETA